MARRLLPKIDVDPEVAARYALGAPKLRKDGQPRATKTAPRGPRGPYRGHAVPVTDEQLERFYAQLMRYPNVTLAFEASGVHAIQLLYTARYREPEVAKRWGEALRIGYEALEAEAYRRAYEGTEEPVFYQGQEVARVRRPSDVLMMFLLKGAMPEKYKDRSATELSGPNGRPMEAISLEITDPVEVAQAYQKLVQGT